MADDNFKVRVEERLKIKIGEAKNLQARTHGSSAQEMYIVPYPWTKKRFFEHLHPFFGEEFQFEVPRNFRFISIYVFDRDRPLKQDKVLGKVAIRREHLASYNNKDHWFPIKAVDADSEVQGKANIEIKFEPEFETIFNKSKPSSYSSNRRLLVQVVKCLDLTLKNGACDPYALVCVTYTNGKRRDNMMCESDSEICELHVSIWHDTPGMSDDVFLGEVRCTVTGDATAKRCT
ncbi:hypothetical protein NQ318_015262 [Aromia moschata]|uniref:C2 domain-containing protein n=1 Tax=Aromia moschata TaxID=1265417 RepID=A0AAV8YH20_9CUCU|nr:hypothetical protein NQ318_015262 [Aromia moschata]